MSVKEITETRQYLTFRLGNEIFATDVAKVREVLDLTAITQIPRTPEFMAGVINLRGSVVPVVDFRLCFEMTKTASTRRIGTQIRVDFIKGMGKRENNFIMILDIDRVFSAGELASFHGHENSVADAVAA